MIKTAGLNLRPQNLSNRKDTDATITVFKRLSIPVHYKTAKWQDEIVELEKRDA